MILESFPKTSQRYQQAMTTVEALRPKMVLKSLHISAQGTVHFNIMGILKV